MFFVLLAWQRLCQHIGSLVPVITDFHVKPFFLYLLPDPMIPRIYMLGSFVEDWIFRYGHCSFIILFNYARCVLCDS